MEKENISAKEEQKQIDLKVTAFEGSADLKRKVTRKELVDVIQQISVNIQDISNYLMADVNGMYRNHVYPFQIRFQALENLVCEKCGITKEEIQKEVYKIQQEILRQAKESGEIIEGEDGVLRMATPKETKEHEKEIIKGSQEN